MAQIRPMDDAREWLEARLRAWVNQARGQGGDGLEPAEADVVRLYEEGRYSEAVIAARQHVDSLRETLGERHPLYATALSNLALSLHKQGDGHAAESLLRQAIEIRREVLGGDDPHYATALNNLALLLCERGDLAAAEPLIRQALEIRRPSLGERHPDHATGLTSLAMLLCARRDLDGAEPLLRQALEIRREVLGEDHPHYATALNNLALLLCERGDLAAAEPLIRRALDVRRETLGADHPDTLSCATALESFRKARTPEPVLLEAPRGGAREARERDVEALREEIDALGARLVLVSDRMAESVHQMRSSGLPPDEAVLEDAAACRHDFARLRAELLELSGPADADAEGSSPPAVVGLADLSRLLEVAARTQAARRRHDAVRARASGILEQVLDLRSRGEDYGETLQTIRSQAQAALEAIDSSPASSLPEEAERLAAEAHPLASLVRLAQGPGELDDETWSEHFGAITAAFGRSVAVALARRRIHLAGEKEKTVHR